ncbi:uncharacterized protein [Nicotiana sylvestris]|uniref:uncharacterized protein n=1 Tax=Nicotiana sylvestris TaxID=4096 RepID=UPI00388CCCF0
MPKTRKEYTDAYRKVMEKNFRAKKILVCGIGHDEYNKISACEIAKEIWKALQIAHEGTTQESKVNAITEAKDLQELTIDELVGNLITYEMKRKIDSERREPKKEKNLVLKAKSNDSSEEDNDMTYLTKRFQKMVRRNGGILKRGNSNKTKNYDLCHKCGKPGHFIKDCPLLKQEHSKYNPKKAAKRNPVPDKHFKRKRCANNVVKQALAALGDSSSGSEDEIDAGDSSMMEIESEENEYDSIFSLMAQSDDDEDDDNSEVNFRDVQRNLKSYSPKKLMSLAKHERDDLVVVVIDHKETIENFSKEKEALVKRVIEFEEERDNLLVVIADLSETIEGLGTESKPENSGKGKEVASEAHIRLENELKAVRANLCVETKKNKHLQTELERGTVKVSSQQWFMDSGCSKHMTRNTMDFLSLKSLQEGSVSFDNGKKGDILGVENGDLSCLKAVDDDVELWHRRLGHASFSLMNKLIQKDLVRGLPMSKFKVQKVCDACARGKHVKSSFKSKKDVSTSKPLDFLYMDLCGPMRVQSRGGKRYIFVIVDDYSSFTWTLFLRTKNETFEVFVAFVKKIQVKIESRVACIRSDHGTEFVNAKFDELCNENGITHNFSASRTPQQNGVVERKNRTLEEMETQADSPKNIGCKCYVLNNGNDPLGKFDAKSDEGIFLGYSSQSKAYKIYNKRTQCVEESVHVIFDESYPSCEKSTKDDQDGEPLLVPGEGIDMTNGKADMMSQVKEPSGDNAASSSREPGTSITTTEAEERVVDAVHGTPQVPERITQGNQLDIPNSSTNEPQMPNWKHKSSHPLDNIITPLDFGVQTRSKAGNSLAFSAFLSQREPKNIKKALKDTHWITSIQDELHQFKRNNVYVDDIIFGATADSLCEEFAKLIGSEFEISMMGELNFFLGIQESTSGLAHFLGSCLISWGTMKQNSVALSIVEAEYVATSSCCGQLLWIKQQLEDFGVFNNCVPLLCDNTSTVNMTKNPIQHKRTKHIDVRYHFLRDNVEKGLICMKFCNTEDQIIDIFMKALSREHFERNRVNLGLLKPNLEPDSPLVGYENHLQVNTHDDYRSCRCIAWVIKED